MRTHLHRAGPADATVVGRLLHDFNTEFDSPTPSAQCFAWRFERLLARDDVLVVLALDEPGGAATRSPAGSTSGTASATHHRARTTGCCATRMRCDPRPGGRGSTPGRATHRD